MIPPAGSMSGAATPTLRLTLLPRAESAVRRGHPWVFAGSIRTANRTGSAGELAVLYDRGDRFLGFGLYDPGSPIRVRILHTGRPQKADDEWWRGRLEAAIARRPDPVAPETNGWRWISGESDGWPGMVLDRYGDTLVWKLYTVAWIPWLPMVEAMIRARLRPEFLMLRLSRNVAAAAAAHGVRDGWLGRPGPEVVAFREHGLTFEAQVAQGQKTGFFLDQRDNRARVRDLARGRDVLNAFSFTGGFSLHAAAGGAKSVTDLDISRHALDGARRHFALNAENPDIRKCRHRCLQADAFEWLRTVPGSETFDLIITDPPSLAKRESERAAAIAAYERLAAAALSRLRPDGILVAASCSAHVRAAEFTAAVRKAAARSGRRHTILWTSGHPPDHPATFPEAEYLKCLALRVAGSR